jgi:short-subunit dehydrogenase
MGEPVYHVRLLSKTGGAICAARSAREADHRTMVNNTAIPATAPLLDSDVEKIDEMIRLNVGALARLTYAAAPGFARGNGTIVNMDSSLAISPETLNGVYGGTKAFVLALSVSLAQTRTRRQGRASSASPAGSDGGGSTRSIPTRT